MSDTIFPEPMDQMDRAMQRMDKKAWAEADAEIALLKARLAEAERLLSGCRTSFGFVNSILHESIDAFLRPADSASDALP